MNNLLFPCFIAVLAVVPGQGINTSSLNRALRLQLNIPRTRALAGRRRTWRFDPYDANIEKSPSIGDANSGSSACERPNNRRFRV